MTSKRVKIIEALYPSGIKPDQYQSLHKIFGLIDHLINETKETPKVKCITMGEALKEVEKEVEESPEPSINQQKI